MKIICIGRNYVAHAKELGNLVPEEPVIFMKPKSALLTSGMSFYYPPFTNELHYECELVVKVCKNGKFIDIRNAWQYYNEITLGIDFTARDLQTELKKKGLPWEKSKAFDQSAVIGEWIKVEELPDRENINFELNLNGVNVQKGLSANMIFSIERILEDASQYFTLNIGDLIFTGTPAGVGECQTGDRLEGLLEGEKLLDFEIK
jgi:2-keto-4-pentenoate hydratase/2-oxohepta-3-ene-1,7-dioic acid hydratase in catechol pathway